MNLDTSANTMNIQSSIKVKECEDIISQDAIQTHKRWSDLPTSQYTTSFREGILQGIMSRINDYVAKLVDRETETSTFQVFLLNTPTIDIEVKELPCKISHPIPIFSRIRSVTVDQTRIMFCGSITCKFSGFTHHDIAVCWWSSYMYYA
jgi:hypothetical protein